MDTYVIPAVLGPMFPTRGSSNLFQSLNSSNSSSLTSSPSSASSSHVSLPKTLLYIIDDHHGLAALDFSQFDDTFIYIDILCDLTSLTEVDFWATMAAQKLVLLTAHPPLKHDALPVPMLPSQLPRSFYFRGSDASLYAFSDDPWRSLVAFSRKVQDASPSTSQCDPSQGDYEYCGRCMYRGCKDGLQQQGQVVSYFEFLWARFFNEAVMHDDHVQWWPSKSAQVEFRGAYEKLSKPVSIGSIDTGAWIHLASLVIPLCRASATAEYSVPSFYPSVGGVLPGYVVGSTKLGKDPICDPPICVAPHT